MGAVRVIVGVDFDFEVELGGVGGLPIEGFMGSMAAAFSRGFRNMLCSSYQGCRNVDILWLTSCVGGMTRAEVMMIENHELTRVGT